MSITTNDVKRGIDKAASTLKAATESVATTSQQASAAATSKAKEFGRKTAAEVIAQGKKLKNASR
jgi:hypothetical protein